jgi:hypothetical protein
MVALRVLIRARAVPRKTFAGHVSGDSLDFTDPFVNGL